VCRRCIEPIRSGRYNLVCRNAINVRIAGIQCADHSTVDAKTCHWEPFLCEKRCKRQADASHSYAANTCDSGFDAVLQLVSHGINGGLDHGTAKTGLYDQFNHETMFLNLDLVIFTS
jgi:hypothetical protein